METRTETIENELLERLAALPEGAEGFSSWVEEALSPLPPAERGSLIGLLIEGLIEASLPKAAWDLLSRHPDWLRGASIPRRDLADLARAVLPGDRGVVSAIIQASGLMDGSESLSSAFRRLRRLTEFAPGIACRHASWGFGVIREFLPLQGEVEIDFEAKKRHVMQLRFAADTVQTFPPGHLLSRRTLEPEKLRAEALADPAKIVRAALEDAGGRMNPQDLADWLKGSVLSDSEWGRWWNAARAAAKADPHIIASSKRNEPWILSDVELSHGDLFDRSFESIKDPMLALRSIDDLIRADPSAMQGQRLDRVRRAIEPRISSPQDASLEGMILLVGEAARIWPERRAEARRRLLDPRRFVEALAGLPSSRAARLLPLLWEEPGGETVRDLFLGALNEVPSRALSLLLDFLMRAGEGDAAGRRLMLHVTDGSAEAEILGWILADPGRAAKIGIRPDALFMKRSLAAIERPYGGDRRRAQRDLSEMLARPEVLKPLLAETPEEELEALVSMVRRSSALGLLLQRSLLAAIVKARPDAQEFLTETPKAAGTAPDRPETCSWRTYRRLQDDLREIIEIQIPENSRELAEARSHGDLSENHQYEAAKERQAVLHARRDELRSLLDRLRPSDFRDVSGATVEPGTTVTLSLEDGETKICHVLGIHDSDPERSMVGSDTPLGSVLLGKRTGDVIRIPSERGEIPARIADVSRLSDEILTYLNPVEDVSR